MADERPETILSNLITWFIFMGMLVLALQPTLLSVVRRLNHTIDDQALDEGGVVSRNYLITSCLFANMSMWYSILFVVFVGYIWCVLVLLLFGFMPVLLRDVCKNFLVLVNPSVIFRCVHLKHIPAHAVIMLISVLTPIIPLLFYVRRTDLTDQHNAMSKVLRVIFITPAIIVFSYFVYAVICCSRCI